MQIDKGTIISWIIGALGAITFSLSAYMFKSLDNSLQQMDVQVRQVNENLANLKTRISVIEIREQRLVKLENTIEYLRRQQELQSHDLQRVQFLEERIKVLEKKSDEIIKELKNGRN